ncbi:MAG: glycosyltransferase [Bacteroidota bacterium]
MKFRDNKIIHGLWIGSSLSKIELLTIHSFLSYGHDFHLWVYDKINTKLPPGVRLRDAASIIPHDKIFRYRYTNQFGHGKGSFAGFSDIFRYKLLYEHGGWWVDMDVCCLKPFDFASPYVFRTHHHLPAVGNVMKCPKGSRLMQLCYESASKNIDEFNTDWHKPLTILNENINKLGLSNYIIDISNQDEWNYLRKLITKNIQPPDDWYAIHWANENWRAINLTKEYFRRNSTIGSLMKKFGLTENNLSWKAKILYEIKLSLAYGILKKM